MLFSFVMHLEFGAPAVDGVVAQEVFMVEIVVVCVEGVNLELIEIGFSLIEGGRAFFLLGWALESRLEGSNFVGVNLDAGKA